MTKVQIGLIVTALTVSGMFSGANALGQEAAAQRSTLDLLRDARLETFTLEVEVERPAHAFLPGQVRATRQLRATVGEDIVAMVWKAVHLPTPRYYPPGTDGYSGADFDSEGNLLVWVKSDRATIHDAETNDEYRENMLFLVSPDGSATQTGPHASMYRSHPSRRNTESLGLLGRVLWALGRPWGSGFGEVKLDEELPDGFRRLRTTTDGWGYRHVAKFKQECELIIAPGAGYLVRHAVLGPRQECHSEGTVWFEDIALAERGEFILGGAETISVRLVSFSPLFDVDLVNEARDIVARARSRRVRVMDYPTDDPTKRLRTVAPGELD